MANRRKFLAGIGALASGSAAAVGTGAFSSTAANRTVSVSVAGDQSAYLGLEPGDSPHAYTSGDELVLDFDGSEVDGEGLNTNAYTKFNDLFTIRNNGGSTTAIWLDDDGDPYVNNGASPTFANNLNIDLWRVFWSFSEDSQPDFYANSEVGYKKWNNPTQTAPAPGRTTDTLGNALEGGIDDDAVLAPVNIDTNKSNSIFNRTAQHPAVLTPGDSIKINVQFNLNDIDPSTVEDVSGSVALNAFSHDFAVDLQS
ncbi:hypothetical protein [Halorubrum ezzemoulense]|uniref:hypothetical protein n=1 Tax=Halorubrum ezzemoulense TaxID=337243 RepID=UPI00117B77E2|nr:hypothetical protein [Halorubrum ezzemoulense]